MKIRVLLVDDHAVVRAGFRLLLASVEAIEVVAEASRCEEACKLYDDFRPDVVVMDLSMPGIGGLEGIRRITARDPEAKILVFSIHDEKVYVERALAAGAKGYITKSSAPEMLITAVQAIAGGEDYIEAGLKASDAFRAGQPDYQALLAALSPKEFDVFRLLAKGLTTHEAADELCLGVKTVANYSTQIKAKLKVNTVAELARLAIDLKIL
ncbi:MULTISPECIES: response regulator [Methylomicrobium]|uniref:Response regulator containing a CheY-like receiver domain and an HTH DNA-binding domain n=1 Tax=Methylomicrobium album BG8 TaxID=686340 RepID=H8GJK2_METAL|nr:MULTISPECIES: response regulator transcription factor [Methylomicrobium]EIC30362.1 response regulator containing a CheY-like receiver domain and an HTH DNA-binding domain [Methylomicrobium album BG8]